MKPYQQTAKTCMIATISTGDVIFRNPGEELKP